MSTQILILSDGRAVLSDNTTEWAYGPVFESSDQAWAFERWMGIDTSRLRDSELQKHYREFVKHPVRECQRCGEPTVFEDDGKLCQGCQDQGCEWCGCGDVPLSCYGNEGWLCANCGRKFHDRHSY